MTPDVEADVLALVERHALIPERTLAGPIIERVATAAGFTVEQLRGPSQAMHIVRARHVAMYAVWKHCHYSLPRIGRMFGGRHHTTVLHAIRKIGREQRKTWSDKEA